MINSEICYLTIILSLYFYIAYEDYRTRYIYDWSILVSLLINLGHAFYKNMLIDSVLAGIAASVLHYSLYKLSCYIYGEEVYGKGDVFLMISIATMLGLKDFLNYQYLEAVLTGAVASILLLGKRHNWYLPMAPVFVFWLVVYLVTGRPDIFRMIFTN